MSRSEIDRLGDRLRIAVTNEDLALLDQYRRGFGSNYDTVVKTIRENFQVRLSGRPAKSTTAIIDKLQRGSIRLSQMQDIAGCRIIVEDSIVQDRLAKDITELFQSKVIDRRKTPSHGYRAVHVIACPEDRPIEIQIRSKSQHLWAEFSEKLADKYGIGIKYGIGERDLVDFLLFISSNIADGEEQEKEIYVLEARVNTIKLNEREDKQEVLRVEQEVKALRDQIRKTQERERDLIASFIEKLV